MKQGSLEKFIMMMLLSISNIFFFLSFISLSKFSSTSKTPSLVAWNVHDISALFLRLLDRDYIDDEEVSKDGDEENGFLKAFKVFFASLLSIFLQLSNWHIYIYQWH